jgi:Ca2+-binding RTX toxin-like protein
MIKVKATKEAQQDGKPSREDYVLEEKEKTGFVPLAFLTFLTGFAIYLKSAFPARSEALPEQQTNRNQVDDAVPSDLAREAEELRAQAEGDVTETVGPAKKPLDNVIAFPSRLVASQAWLDNFLASDSPIEIVPIDSQGRATNDNQSAGQVHSRSPGGGGGSSGGNRGGGSGGGGGDGGGGGGGSESDSRNRAPRTSGPILLKDTVNCHAYPISVLALLAGAMDPDGDQLRPVDISVSSGTLKQAEAGGWIYTPEEGMHGVVTLTYSIWDGTNFVQQVAYFRVVEPPPIVGTDSADNLLGTDCCEVIAGLNGDDNIDAKAGDDEVVGGDGDDQIVGGTGDDLIYAGFGHDIVIAGSGDDIVFGGPGNDRVFGEGGSDTIYGAQGDDLIMGGEGRDVIFAGSQNDSVHGEEGNDVVDGGDGNDTLHGGAGDDVLLGCAGNDVVYGNEGDDVVHGNEGGDAVDGGEGDDVVDGGEGNDNLHGGAGQDELLAGAGRDVVHGDAGDDVLSDGGGQDLVFGGEGNDCVISAADAVSDAYSGGAGEDTLDYSSAILSIVIDVGSGTADGLDIGKDLISGFEMIITGQGDDHITAAASAPITITGGNGNDTFEFQSSADDYQPDLVRKITDFTVGDRIIAASYEIRYCQEGEVDDQIGQLFDDIYLSNDADHRPIRFRFEKLDNGDLTFVDVHDGTDPEEFYSIELSGRHDLEFIVAVS